MRGFVERSEMVRLVVELCILSHFWGIYGLFKIAFLSDFSSVIVSSRLCKVRHLLFSEAGVEIRVSGGFFMLD